MLTALTGSAPVWIVDPIDGTRNFVAGSGRFSTLVALCRRRRAARLLDVRTGSGPHRHGAGRPRRPCGRRTGPRGRGSPPDGAPTLPITTSHPVWWPNGYGRGVDAMRAADLDVRYFDACGIEYLDLAAGSRSAMVITWEFCWDHAAGLLLVAEAGGHVAALDGAPVRLEGGNVLPFVASTDQATTDRIRTLIVESQ